MREILFRGKSVDTGEWVEGDLMSYHEKHRSFIAWSHTAYRSGEVGFDRLVTEDYHEVDPETVGQFTGLMDKNGKMIFEGDVVKCTDGADETNELNPDTGTGEVEWLKKWGFWNISNIENGLGDILHNGYVEVIGNIHDNPELMEEL